MHVLRSRIISSATNTVVLMEGEQCLQLFSISAIQLFVMTLAMVRVSEKRLDTAAQVCRKPLPSFLNQPFLSKDIEYEC